ncbi:MAG: SUF system Fe-S cluster assembly protein [Alphaproteobacteria bacterium]|nr:SUF system Fe-S cluster assembly protein [Alphaproteobacteria bacterium]
MNDEHMPRTDESVTNESVTDESVTDKSAPVDYENLSPAQQAMTDDIIGALKSVYDPEIPVDIYELGLIYRVEITDARDVIIDMTLTAPGCPVAEQMPIWVQDAIGAVEGVGDVKVNMVFEPAWDISRMSDEARVALNMF